MERKDMLVEEVMKRKVVTVKRYTTLRELIGIFGKFTFHTLPVIESKKIHYFKRINRNLW